MPISNSRKGKQQAEFSDASCVNSESEAGTIEHDSMIQLWLLSTQLSWPHHDGDIMTTVNKKRSMYNE